MNLQVENTNAQIITPAKGKNPRTLYEHQINAMQALDKLDSKPDFKTLLVLPTGGGKTLTAAYWLLKNAIDKDKKILWIAHRHLLLEQAAEAFSLNAYTDIMINNTSFSYRIISGIHDKPIHIKKSDNILFASKDSLIRNLDFLDDWLKNEEIYLVIDEAHHAVAKSYRKIIDHVYKKTASAKLLGLTATPFRTSEEEAGALKQIFTDDIVYKTDLDTLIKKEILAKPVCQEFNTDILLGGQLGLKAIKNIESLDIIPEELAEEIANNSERNKFIVNKYFENYKTYGPTIVFALNQNHAIALNALFNEQGKKYGIKSDYIISSVRDMITGATISTEENNKKIESYRNNEIQVLINVNILTEGTDLPKTHSVFLTRPTVSTVLMTQMVGRALRGERAGGTKEAYIVSFIDNWNSRIAWVNPETLTEGSYVRDDSETKHKAHEMRMIAIAKLEEFALIADTAVDTSRLEGIPAIERIPLGMYTFSFIDSIDEQSMERYHQILVYNSTKNAYDELIKALPYLFEDHNITEEVIPEEKLRELIEICRESYFDDNMIPAYNPKDIEYLLKFYAQKETEPLFITFDEIDRKKLDLSVIAKEIYDKDMRRSEEAEFIKSLWEENGSIFPIYYSNIYFFKKMIQVELDKLSGDIPTIPLRPETAAEKRKIEELPLQKIIDKYPAYGIGLRDTIFERSKDKDGFYVCANCGFKSKTHEFLQIDHIKPLSKGGLTTADNLQVLCRRCNAQKGDKE